MKEVINLFCIASGQNISESKSFVLANARVLSATKQSIAAITGFTFTNDLGKYLGVPLLHNRVTKATYAYIIKKVQCKLTSWNLQNLRESNHG